MGRRRGILAVTVGFVLCRAGYAAAGLRFDDSALHPANFLQVQWQLLPLNLLRHDPASSIWNLHSQPPLYNLLAAILLHLPGAARLPAAAALFLLLGLALAGCTFMLLTEFGIRTVPAVAITLVAVADPATVLYENWLSWSYPSAVAVTAGVLGLVRFARSRAPGWAALSASAFSALVLLDTTFQWPWLLAVSAALLLAAGRPVRAAALSVAVPLALVAGWTVKDAAQFGTATTSSWLGMNLYQTTLAHAPAGEVERLIAAGTLTPLASVPAFGPVGAYTPRFVADQRTGVAALDQATGEDGVANFNAAAYVPVSRRYLGQDLAYLQARPGRYAATVGWATRLWTIPPAEYFWNSPNLRTIGGWARVFDAAVLLQPERAADRVTLTAETAGARPGPAQLSWMAVAVTFVDLVVAPAVLWRRRRDRLWLAGGGVMWLTVLYSFVVTSATEVAENMRFRFELGAVPLVLAVVTLAALRESRRTAG